MNRIDSRIPFRRRPARRWPPLLLVLGLGACAKAPEAPLAEEPTVASETIRFPPTSQAVARLATARLGTVRGTVISLPGRLAWDEDRTSRVMAPVSGRVTQLLVQAGQQVKADQPLAVLSSAEIGTAQAEAAKARADLAQAERSLARAQDLAQAGIVAAKDLEQAQGDLARGRAESERTQLRLRSLGGAVTVDQRYALRSPLAGVVVERNANVGMEWRPDQPLAPLFVVSDPATLWCWIDAPERSIGQLQPGQALRIRAAAWPDDVIDARIDHVADTLDPQSRTLKVRARLANPLRHLKAEMFVMAEIAGQQPAGTLDMPPQAVFLSDGAQRVFVKTGPGQFVRKMVGGVSDNSGNGSAAAAPASNVKAGDEVVVDGALYLQQLLQAAHVPAQAVAGAGAGAATAETQPARQP